MGGDHEIRRIVSEEFQYFDVTKDKFRTLHTRQDILRVKLIKWNRIGRMAWDEEDREGRDVSNGMRRIRIIIMQMGQGKAEIGWDGIWPGGADGEGHWDGGVQEDRGGGGARDIRREKVNGTSLK